MNFIYDYLLNLPMIIYSIFLSLIWERMILLLNYLKHSIESNSNYIPSLLLLFRIFCGDSLGFEEFVPIPYKFICRLVCVDQFDLPPPPLRLLTPFLFFFFPLSLRFGGGAFLFLCWGDISLGVISHVVEFFVGI